MFVHPLEEVDWVDTECPRNLPKLDNIKPSFAPFILGDERLRTRKLLSESRLAEGRPFPGLHQEYSETVVFIGEDGTWHTML